MSLATQWVAENAEMERKSQRPLIEMKMQISQKAATRSWWVERKLLHSKQKEKKTQLHSNKSELEPPKCVEIAGADGNGNGDGERGKAKRVQRTNKGGNGNGNNGNWPTNVRRIQNRTKACGGGRRRGAWPWACMRHELRTKWNELHKNYTQQSDQSKRK